MLSTHPLQLSPTLSREGQTGLSPFPTTLSIQSFLLLWHLIIFSLLVYTDCQIFFLNHKLVRKGSLQPLWLREQDIRSVQNSNFSAVSSQASLVAQLVKNLPAMQETWFQSLGWEDPLEKGKVTHSSILAWRIPWMVYSMGSQSQTQMND